MGDYDNDGAWISCWWECLDLTQTGSNPDLPSLHNEGGGAFSLATNVVLPEFIMDARRGAMPTTTGGWMS